jgi:hypothetical protein
MCLSALLCFNGCFRREAATIKNFPLRKCRRQTCHRRDKPEQTPKPSGLHWRGDSYHNPTSGNTSEELLFQESQTIINITVKSYTTDLRLYAPTMGITAHGHIRHILGFRGLVADHTAAPSQQLDVRATQPDQWLRDRRSVCVAGPVPRHFVGVRDLWSGLRT